MNNIKEDDISMVEVLQAINNFATKTQEQFDKIQEQFNKVQEQFDKIQQQFDKIHQTLSYHETWLKKIENNMASKAQFNSLLNILERKEVLSNYEVHHIKTAELI